MNNIHKTQDDDRATETVQGTPPSPATRWTACRDERFFRIVYGAFAPHWLEGATALLGSYDDSDT